MNNYDALDIARMLTMFCFGLWAVGTFTIIAGVTFGKLNFHNRRKMDWNNPFDVIAVSTIAAWFSMWCFRTMY